MQNLCKKITSTAIVVGLMLGCNTYGYAESIEQSIRGALTPQPGLEQAVIGGLVQAFVGNHAGYYNENNLPNREKSFAQGTVPNTTELLALLESEHVYIDMEEFIGSNNGKMNMRQWYARNGNDRCTSYSSDDFRIYKDGNFGVYSKEGKSWHDLTALMKVALAQDANVLGASASYESQIDVLKISLVYDLEILNNKKQSIDYLGNETKKVWNKDFRVEKYIFKRDDGYTLEYYYYFDGDRLKIIRHNTLKANSNDINDTWTYIYSVKSDFDTNIIKVPENITK